MIDTRRGLGLGGFLLLVLLMVLVVAAAGIFPFRQLLAQERAVDLTQEKLDALVGENLRLEQQIAALRTDEEVERLAREHFGLVMAGEVGYMAVVPEDIVDPVPAGRDTTLEREQPLWGQVWDFLTGRDIVDG
ncbi:MAG: septum formation initiator family protein [Acidimicrobiia bacterium]